METLPCSKCPGLCCGPVQITSKELKNIKKKVKSMPKGQRSQLEGQQRYLGTCIFYDLDENKCGIYSARPEICKMFGFAEQMPCFRKPEAASVTDWELKEEPIGLLSVDFTWVDFR
ncbi:YkgJ family cysteine cluster protein [Radiobacillus kanasensis]|uniref:YkgJ family cysteine cluster protein n=1 Tax=Radiobacillus kanasensis TaxID=2844358 RepID=UPI001E550A53|nr:YkgJ family cysteine cluster protein [Radiobacillus kanasensis]UFU00697.1 YkgJ family cysteine cluster protein [Radiobacillus kanasensis]